MADKHWSKSLQQLTYDKLEQFSVVKNYKEPFHGIVSHLEYGKVVISNIVVKNCFPIPGEQVLAEYKGIQAMIDDGWVID